MKGVAVTVALAALTASGCSITGLGEDRAVGRIEMSDVENRILIPQFTRGDAFAVTVFTSGGGCWRAGDTDVSISGNEVTLTPYDIHSGADACDDVHLLLEHSLRLARHPFGTTRIRIRARTYPEGRPIEIVDSVVSLPHPGR